MNYRIGRNWSAEELEPKLDRALKLVRNFEPSRGELTFANGWNQITSQSLVASEAPGSVVPGGAFATLSEAVRQFTYSDPRIVRMHTRAGLPLLERRVLLELRGPGIYVLAPVQITCVREKETEREVVYGFCFDTLQGHIEAGREWFFLRKDKLSGDIRFRIQAAWREGHFRNPILHLGFKLVGRHYQRAWHHLAHARLREHLLQQMAGAKTSRMPVDFWAARAVAATAADIEKERELHATG